MTLGRSAGVIITGYWTVRYVTENGLRNLGTGLTDLNPVRKKRKL